MAAYNRAGPNGFIHNQKDDGCPTPLPWAGSIRPDLIHGLALVLKTRIATENDLHITDNDDTSGDDSRDASNFVALILRRSLESLH